MNYLAAIGNKVIEWAAHVRLENFIGQKLANRAKETLDKVCEELEKRASFLVRDFLIGVIVTAFFFAFFTPTIITDATPRTITPKTLEALQSTLQENVKDGKSTLDLSFYEFINITQKSLTANKSYPFAFLSTFITLVFYVLKHYPEGYSFIQPFTDIWSTFQLYFMRVKKSKHENDSNYPSLCIIGWNILERNHDNKDNTSYILSMPTEITIHLDEIFIEASDLQEKVLESIFHPNKPADVPNFILVVPNNPKDPNNPNSKTWHQELHRFICNCISNSVSSSSWPKYAHNYKNFNKHLYEKALYLITYEYDAPVKAVRVWLMFPEELKILLTENLPDLKTETIKKHFRLQFDTWDVRIRNLHAWANFAFEKHNKEYRLKGRNNGDMHTGTIQLPLFNEEEIRVTIEWNIFHHSLIMATTPQQQLNRMRTVNTINTSNTVHNNNTNNNTDDTSSIGSNDMSNYNDRLLASSSVSMMERPSKGQFEVIISKSCELDKLICGCLSLKSYLLQKIRYYLEETEEDSSITTTSSNKSNKKNPHYNETFERQLHSLIQDLLTEEFNHSNWCQYAYRHRYQDPDRSSSFMIMDHNNGVLPEVYYYITYEDCFGVRSLQILLCFKEDLEYITSFDMNNLCYLFKSRGLSPDAKRKRFEILREWGNSQSLEQNKVLIPIFSE